MRFQSQIMLVEGHGKSQGPRMYFQDDVFAHPGSRCKAIACDSRAACYMHAIVQYGYCHGDVEYRWYGMLGCCN